MSQYLKQTTALINGCVANDRSAQEALYKLYYAMMFRLCCRYLKTNDLAKEALNMGFLKIFQHISSFDTNKGDFGTWARAVMIRTCIDLGRKEQKFNVTIDEAQISENIFLSPTVLDKLFAEDLIRLVRVLPSATQVVFNLSVIDGYTHKEIAAKLNISESTSRWHLSEGKKQLRTLLDTRKEYESGPTENRKRE